MQVRGFVWWLAKTFAGFLISTKGFVLIAGLVAWTSTLNVSTNFRQQIEDTFSAIVNMVGGRVFYLVPIIMVAIAYRFPKTIMLLTSATLATVYLTPIGKMQEITTYLWLVAAASIIVFGLAAVFLGLKLRTKAPVTIQ